MTHELEVSDSDVGDEGQHVEAAQALAAAVVQIDLAVREAQAPVDRLTLLIDCLAEALSELRTASSASGETGTLNPDSPDEPESPLVRLQKDLYLCVTQLQFYDRLVQHMAHVQDYLASAANELASPSPASRDVWDTLRIKLRARLISAAQRELLDSILSPETGPTTSGATARAEYASQGSIELF
jgi:hypothetical protein